MPSLVNASCSIFSPTPVVVRLAAMAPIDWQNWRIEAAGWTHRNLGRLLVVIIVALILMEVLRAFTRRLGRFSERQVLPHGVRAQQLRTLATVIDSVGISVIV